MAKGGGQREGSALKTAVVVTGGLVLAWITVETAFKPFLDRLRAAVSRSTGPSRDPDEEPAAAPLADEDKAPTPVASAVDGDKQPAFAAAEPSAPPLPAEEVAGSEKKGEDNEVELEEKGEGAVAAKAE